MNTRWFNIFIGAFIGGVLAFSGQWAIALSATVSDVRVNVIETYATKVDMFNLREYVQSRFDRLEDMILSGKSYSAKASVIDPQIRN